MWFLLTTAASLANIAARLVAEARRRKGFIASLRMLRLLTGAYWFYAKAYVCVRLRERRNAHS